MERWNWSCTRILQSPGRCQNISNKRTLYQLFLFPECKEIILFIAISRLVLEPTQPFL
jgi:hypothetical protein